MRRTVVGWLGVVFLLLLAFPAAADTVVFGDTVYAYSGGAAAAPTFTLAVQGKSLDAETLELVVEPYLAGAVFSVYGKSGDGFVPFPDPSDPSRPLVLESRDAPLSVALPLSVDLYIRQDAAPEGYLLGENEGVYMPLSLPGTITIENDRAGMQGVRVTQTGSGAVGSVPLAGVRFLLSGQGKTIELTTDEAGVAHAIGIAPGQYTLVQTDVPEGYRVERTAKAVTVAENAIADVAVENARDGQLLLRALGMAADGQRQTRLVAIDRRYEVLGADGAPVGVAVPGEALALPAGPEGSRYTLRQVGAADDGFEADAAVHEVWVYSGRVSECQTVVRSAMGLFAFAHISARDGLPVAGGAFVLLDARDNAVLSFEADAQGHYTPGAPLMPGAYTLTMAYAGEDHLYNGHAVPVEIAPFFSSNAVTEVVFASEPLPEDLLHPRVTVAEQKFDSLFVAGAEVDFTLALARETTGLSPMNVAYTMQVPEAPGVMLVAERPDGGVLRAVQRFALDGVMEIAALTVAGEVRYTFRYPVSATEQAERSVSAPYSVEVAAFASHAKAQYAVSGHVTDEAGAIVTGLPVTLEDAGGKVLAETVTDPFGAYAFEKKPDGARVRFHAVEGFGALAVGADARILPLETVTGHVVKHGAMDGYPVTLSIGALEPKSPGKDGRFAFEGVQIAGETIAVQTPEGVLWRMEEGQDGAVVHLYAAASVSGHVKDPEGKPVPGVEVTLTGGGEVRTDGDGYYEIGALYPGEYALAFAVPEGMIANGAVEETLVLEAGDARVIDTSMMEPATVAGVVTDDGAPLSGVVVTLAPSGLTAVTDGEGRFAFAPLSTGTYTLSLALPEGASPKQPLSPVEITRSAERVTLAIDTIRPITLSGVVWNDLNDDGLRAPDEPGLALAEVTLLGADGAAITSITTPADGGYAFADLLPGVYRIAVALPEGMIFAKEAPDMERLIAGVDAREAVSEPITLRSGDRPRTALSGAVTAVTLSGFVWEDQRVNGVYDAATDPLAEGVAVALLRDGVVVREAATDARGAYSFGLMRPGSYALRMTLPEGWLFSSVTAGEGIQSDMPDALGPVAERTVTLSSRRPEAVANAGIQRMARLSVTVWLDADADGNHWNEKGYSGAALALYGNGAGEVLVADGVTGADGVYAFEGLRPGAYRLAYRLPEDGWGFSAGAESMAVFVENGASAAVEAGVSKLGNISGQVFADEDYDGYRSEGNAGLAATVYLIHPASGEVLSETRTGQDGAFAFDGLFAGRYVVRFALAEGHYFTRNQGDAPSYSSNVPETAASLAETATLFLPMGEALIVDAGGYKVGEISGAVWQDLRNTGVYADGNAPLSGVAVTLLRDGAPYRETVSDDAGQYGFDALPPGSYTVRATLPEGMRFSLSAKASGARVSSILGTDDATGETAEIALKMGARVADVDIGAVLLGGLSGSIRSALDGSPLSGVAVTLAASGQAAVTVVSGADGRYHAEGIRPGVATVSLVPPDGWIAGEADGLTFDAVIPQGESASREAVLLMPQAVVYGGLWLDADGDGARGATEQPLTGASVTLVSHTDGEDADIGTLTTADDGRFGFEGLVPGSYSLRLSLPDGVYCYAGEGTEAQTLAMGQTVEAELGAYVGAKIAGVAWDDLNDNGRWDADEPAMGGITIALDGGGTVREAVTDEHGAYSFDALPPMEAALRFTPPQGYLIGKALPDVVQLSMGDVHESMDAGFLRYARVGDLVWLDENGNGLQETSEPGIPGVLVTLHSVLEDGALQQYAETVTDVHGRYRFDAVMPGLYVLTFSLDAYVPTKPVSTLPQINSKLPWRVAETPVTDPVFVHSGERLLSMDVGVVTAEMARVFGWEVDGGGGITE